MEMKCLVVLLLQVSWAFAQGAGGFEGYEGMGDFGGFSLIQSDLPADGAGASNETSNDTSAAPQVPGNGDQQLLFNPGGQPAMQADQPQSQPEQAPTRPPSAAGPTTPPPLVRQEGNATATNATTAAPSSTETPKSPKGQGDGSAQFIGNFLLVFGGACVLHLLY